MHLGNLEDVFVEQISDLYSAETQLVEALPKVASAVSSEGLREAFEEHLQQTRGHVERLEEVFATTSLQRREEECEAMKGLIAEGGEIVETEGAPYAKDAALIAAAQRIEHYEIAAYGSAREMAKELGLDDASTKLGDTLDEEAIANELLTMIATGGVFTKGVNPQAKGR